MPAKTRRFARAVVVVASLAGMAAAFASSDGQLLESDPVSVVSVPVAPNFGHPGGGLQYFVPDLDDLISH